ncbi:MAG: transporter substrate-binding domain-containing protein [Acidobacteriaceae bacterium]
MLAVLAVTAASALGQEVVAGAASVGSAAPSSTLERVRAAGALVCGIDQEEPEYSTSDEHGNRAAFDADLCRAVAVAVLGERARIQLVNYPDDRTSMAGLQSGAVQMIPSLTDDFTHAVGTHLRFTAPVLWDGVGFLVHAKSPVTEARQLSGKKVCFIAETNTEQSVRWWFAQEHLDYVPFPFQEEGEMEAAFATGNCAALAGDRTHLAATRELMDRHNRPARLLTAVISKDPLAAAVRSGDPQWAEIVDWVVEALVQTEESGVTRSNVNAVRARVIQGESAVRGQGSVTGTDPALWFLLGGARQMGAVLGLRNDWVVQMIATTGNYGEIYARDLGSGSVLDLPRGENRLYGKGGVMVALPVK